MAKKRMGIVDRYPASLMLTVNVKWKQHTDYECFELQQQAASSGCGKGLHNEMFQV